MKRLLSLFILLVLGIGAFFAKDYLPFKQKKEIAWPVTEEKSFVIVVPSYNNEQYIERNLRSIFSQQYENYRVIYVDDCSRDETLERAKRLLYELDTKKRATLIHNPVNLGALANIYNAVHSCHDHEIIVLVDGDDHLAHDQVLSRLNQAYSNPSVWLSYGNYLDYPTYVQSPQICRPYKDRVLENGTFRKAKWSATPLRTFYASLFKEIQLSDLFYRGTFYSMASDIAYMIPLLELASSHIAYIDETLYLYNRENPINDHKLNIAYQRECHGHILSRSPYRPLSHLPSHISAKQGADFIILSEDNPLGVLALLESAQALAKGIEKTTVLYTASSPEIDSYYLELKLDYPQVHFVKSDGKRSLMSALQTPQESPHVLLASDTQIIKDHLDLTRATELLRLSKADGLYLSHHKALTFSASLSRHLPLPPMTPLGGLARGEIPFAWQYNSGIDDWNTPSPLSLALFSKERLKNRLKRISFDTVDSLELGWNQILPEEEVALFYSKAKSASLNTLPALTKHELSEKFAEGLKIDIAHYFQLESPSKEISANFAFLPRDQD